FATERSPPSPGAQACSTMVAESSASARSLPAAIAIISFPLVKVFGSLPFHIQADGKAATGLRNRGKHGIVRCQSAYCGPVPPRSVSEVHEPGAKRRVSAEALSQVQVEDRIARRLEK